MKRTSFVTHFSDGDESIMELDGITAARVIFNRKSREIFIEYEDEQSAVDLELLSAKEIKKLVIDNGGKYTNKKEGIAFLLSL